MKISKETNIAYVVITIFLAISLVISKASLFFLLLPVFTYALTWFGARLIEMDKNKCKESEFVNVSVQEYINNTLRAKPPTKPEITEDAEFEIIQPKQIEDETRN